MIKKAITFTLSALVLLTVSCRQSEYGDSSLGTDITLGAIYDGTPTTLQDAYAPQSGYTPPSSKAAQPLAADYKFRLYVFAKGETDFANLVATRVYRIADASGTPVLDDGELPLSLEAKSYDTYIVGPLLGVGAHGEQAEIASASGVNCHIGNDILSSYTPLTVVKDIANTLTPTPLSHRMSKVSVQIQRPSNATYTDLNVYSVTAYAQPTSGTFEFNAQGGTIVPTAAKSDRDLTPEDLTTDGGVSKFYCEDYFLPQPKQSLKIGTVFSAVTPPADTLFYEQSGVVDVELSEGAHNRFSTELLISSTVIWRLKLVPWSDRPGTVITEELVLYLDGLDAPITIDGAQYWPDRSGLGNHAKLVGSVTHNKSEYYYQVASDANLTDFLEIPALGKFDNILIELVCRSERGLQSSVLASGDDLNISIPYDNNDIVSNWGPNASTDRLQTPYLSSNTSAMRWLSTWQFSRQRTTSTSPVKIYRDGVLLAVGNTTSRELNLGVASLLSKNSSRVKLHAVRIYRKVLSEATLVLNAKADRESYGSTTLPIIAVLPYMADRILPPLDGGKHTVHVTSNVPWAATSAISGVAVAPPSGPAGTTRVAITVPGSPSSETRDIPVVFAADFDGETKTATWIGSQLSYGFELSSTSQSNIPGNPGENGVAYSITVSSDHAWAVINSPGGVTVSPMSGSRGYTQVSIRVPMNPDTPPRDIPVEFTEYRSGVNRTITWVGAQLSGPALFGSYILRKEIAQWVGSIVREKWPANKLPKTGLQVASVGNVLPGTTPTDDDLFRMAWSTVETDAVSATPALGMGKDTYNALHTLPSAQYLVGHACDHLGSGWYVGSADEMTFIVDYPFARAYLFSGGNYYWCSTQASKGDAYCASKGGRIGDNLGKRFNELRVRCIREF